MQPKYQHVSEEEIKTITNKQAFNINIGVLGHVDSGKTSLCRVMSQITSTASLDKNPQSQERGITLDLGFSAFFARVPERLEKEIAPKKYLQFTLVDCPGHASLLKTVIGGAQIIDIMFLVIDVNKGIQTQTGECISIGELFIEKIIVILNKIDTLENESEVLPKKIEALRKVFSKTKYGSNISFIPFSSKQPEKYHSLLLQTLLNTITLPERQQQGPFLMLIDHCFPIKGKGSVVTGTVVSGSIKPNDEVQFPLIKQSKKVKSLQMFKKPVNSAIQGDRVALLFTQLQSNQIERGLCCTPKYISKMQNIIIRLNKIKYYKLQIKNKAKFHIISGHQTAMANIRIFYNYLPSQDEKFDFKQQFQTGNSYESILEEAKQHQKPEPNIYAILTFEKQFYSNVLSTIVGYKFDGDINQNICRLAFYGKIIETLKTQQIQNGALKIFKNKIKKGLIDKIVDPHTLIVKDLFKKDVNLQQFIGKQITILKTQNKGKIIGTFGNSGKVRVYFETNILESQGNVIDEVTLIDEVIEMEYKKYYSAKQ